MVTPEPVSGNPDYYGGATATYGFSPDGTEIALWSRADAGGQLWIAQADGSGMRRVDLPFAVLEASYRPPNGAELIVTGSTNGGPGGVYAVDPRTGAHRTIVAPVPGVGVGYVRVSPDGSRLAYSGSADALPGVTVGNSYRVHVVGIDDGVDKTLPLPPGAVFQDAPAWSNDGTRLAITRGYAQHNEDMVLAVVPADGSGTGVESTHGLTGCCDTILQWSPDDSRILVTPENLEGTMTQQLLLDPSTRRVRAGAVDGDEPARLAANRPLDGRPRTAVRPARRRNGGGQRRGLQQVPAPSRPSRSGQSRK